MKTNTLTIARIESMYQDGAISEVEYLDLLKKFIARQQKAMNQN